MTRSSAPGGTIAGSVVICSGTRRPSLYVYTTSFAPAPSLKTIPDTVPPPPSDSGPSGPDSTDKPSGIVSGSTVSVYVAGGQVGEHERAVVVGDHGVLAGLRDDVHVLEADQRAEAAVRRRDDGAGDRAERRRDEVERRRRPRRHRDGASCASPVNSTVDGTVASTIWIVCAPGLSRPT